MLDKIKLYALGLFMGLKRLETNSLNQKCDVLTDNSEVSDERNDLASKLLKGEVTKEVETLRHRNYKILREAENYKTIVVGYDDDGIPITKTFKNRDKSSVRFYKGYKPENVKLKYIVKNELITSGTYTTDLNNYNTKTGSEVLSKVDIINKYPSKFKIHKYIDRVLIGSRKNSILSTDLIGVISIKPYYEYNDNLFEMFKRYLTKPKVDFDYIDEIKLTTDGTDLGIDSNTEVILKVDKFESIETHKGYTYLIFKLEDVFYKDMLEQYIVKDLDRKYKNKEKKDIK